MTVVRLDPTSPVPPFEQLRVQLTDHIRSGTVAPGALLPTVRQLAADLGIAKNTVARAYQALELDGLVRGDRRNGTVVMELAPPTSRQRAQLIAEAARRYLAELAQLGATQAEAVAAVERA